MGRERIAFCLRSSLFLVASGGSDNLLLSSPLDVSPPLGLIDTSRYIESLIPTKRARQHEIFFFFFFADVRRVRYIEKKSAMAIPRQDCGMICKFISTTVSTSIGSLSSRACLLHTNGLGPWRWTFGIEKKRWKKKREIIIIKKNMAAQAGATDLVNLLQLFLGARRRGNETERAAKGEEEAPSRFVTLWIRYARKGEEGKKKTYLEYIDERKLYRSLFPFFSLHIIYYIFRASYSGDIVVKAGENVFLGRGRLSGS